MEYDFEWDPFKAKANIVKHGITFKDAATIFQDPHALSIFDPDHSIDEDRWITLGLSTSGRLLLVCHTFREMNEDQYVIRIFSGRKATRKEAKHYAGKTNEK